ncbi:MAG TPA: hypothetical protein VGS11_08130 [Candidatus Bathyarchaeia archaeon]|nr:hypothetical protein [Candidatus Bathyarchaeia archaeon]
MPPTPAGNALSTLSLADNFDGATSHRDLIIIVFESATVMLHRMMELK